jgi:hypothetical protein
MPEPNEGARCDTASRFVAGPFRKETHGTRMAELLQ